MVAVVTIAAHVTFGIKYVLHMIWHVKDVNIRGAFQAVFHRVAVEIQFHGIGG